MLILDGVRFTEWLASHSGVARVAGEHVATVVCAALLLLLWMSLGCTVRTWLTRAEGESTLSGYAAITIDSIVGASVLAVAMLLLGAVGAISNVSVVVLTLLAAIVARHAIVEYSAGIWQSVQDAPRWALGIGALGFVVVLMYALIPPMDWDTLAYHLRLSLGALDTGHLGAPADARGYASLFGVAHLAALPLLALGLMEGAAVLHLLLIPIVIAGTVELARSMRPDASSTLITAMLIGCPAVLLVAWSGRIDLVLTLSALAAHLAVLHAIDARSKGAIAVAALAMGATLGVKSIGAAYIVALLPLVLIGRPLPAALVWRGVALTLVACLPWFIKSYVIAGTPVFPLWYWGTLEPWLANLATPAELAAGFDVSGLATLERAREPFSAFAAFFDPARITIETEGRFYALSPLLLVFPAIVFIAGKRRRWWMNALVPLIFIALVVLPATANNLRFLMPAYPALIAVTAVVLASFVSTFPRVRTLVVVAATCVAVLPAWNMMAVRAPRFMRQVNHAVGADDAATYLRRSPSFRSLEILGSEITKHGSVRDTVLLLWEARAPLIPQPTIIDPFHANWPFLSQLSATESCLAGTGIRWVVVGHATLTYFQEFGTPAEMMRMPQLDAFRDRCLGPPVHRRDGFLAYPVLSAARTEEGRDITLSARSPAVVGESPPESR